MAVKPIPEGYPRVIPYLSIDAAASAIDFYTAVLGAKERMRMPGPHNTVGHAELEIGDSVIMLADNPNASPKKLNGTAVSMMVCLPVKNGWQLLQTSTRSSGRVEPTVKVVPHEAQWTSAW